MVKVPVRKAGVTWVTPRLLVEISYPNAGADGTLRHPRYKGLRDDLVVA